MFATIQNDSQKNRKELVLFFPLPGISESQFRLQAAELTKYNGYLTASQIFKASPFGTPSFPNSHETVVSPKSHNYFRKQIVNTCLVKIL